MLAINNLMKFKKFMKYTNIIIHLFLNIKYKITFKKINF